MSAESFNFSCSNIGGDIFLVRTSEAQTAFLKKTGEIVEEKEEEEAEEAEEETAVEKKDLFLKIQTAQELVHRKLLRRDLKKELKEDDQSSCASHEDLVGEDLPQELPQDLPRALLPRSLVVLVRENGETYPPVFYPPKNGPPKSGPPKSDEQGEPDLEISEELSEAFPNLLDGPENQNEELEGAAADAASDEAEAGQKAGNALVDKHNDKPGLLKNGEQLSLIIKHIGKYADADDDDLVEKWFKPTAKAFSKLKRRLYGAEEPEEKKNLQLIKSCFKKLASLEEIAYYIRDWAKLWTSFVERSQGRIEGYRYSRDYRSKDFAVFFFGPREFQRKVLQDIELTEADWEIGEHGPLVDSEDESSEPSDWVPPPPLIGDGERGQNPINFGGDSKRTNLNPLLESRGGRMGPAPCPFSIKRVLNHRRIISRLISPGSDKVNDSISDEKLRISWFRLTHISDPRIRNDRDIVLALIKKEPRAVFSVNYARERGHDVHVNSLASEFRNDRELVLTAVSRFGQCLQGASENLKDDRQIVEIAVRNDAKSIQYASSRLKNDRRLVQEAIRGGGGGILKCVGDEMRNDPDIVLEAVRNGGYSLQYAGEELRNSVSSVNSVSEGNSGSSGSSSGEIGNENGNGDGEKSEKTEKKRKKWPNCKTISAVGWRTRRALRSRPFRPLSTARPNLGCSRPLPPARPRRGRNPRGLFEDRGAIFEAETAPRGTP